MVVSGLPQDQQIARVLAGESAAAAGQGAPGEMMGLLLLRDGLTGLYNRRYLRHRLMLALSDAQSVQAPLSLLVLDLNDFKQTNDRLGHAAGDLVLQAVARELVQVTPPEGFAARYGGDEFVVVLPGWDTVEAVYFAHRLFDSLCQTEVPRKGQEPLRCIRPSIGVATWPHDADDGQELFRAADVAMYRAKRAAGGRTIAVAGEAAGPAASAVLLVADCRNPDAPDLFAPIAAAHGGTVKAGVRGRQCPVALFRSLASAVRAACELSGELTAVGAQAGISLAPLADESGSLASGAPGRAEHLAAAAHAGQVLLAGSLATRAASLLPVGAELLPLGEHRLADLGPAEPVFQLCPPHSRLSFGPIHTLDAVPHNLPVMTTGFVGREAALAQVQALLQTRRLLTITGPGGTGKSRLALQAVATLLPLFPDGIWQVDTADLTEPEQLLSLAAGAMSPRDLRGPHSLENICQHLQERRVLLLLDNCEHLAEACGRLALELLSHCPGITICAASRVPLGVAEELVWQLPPLSLPGEASSYRAVAHSESVRLFMTRARLHRPGFMLTEENAPLIASICHRLDGIPLAIELAAAQVRRFCLEEIHQQLAVHHGLERSLPGASGRRGTMLGMMDWSYSLLTEAGQTLLVRLAVFVGGFSIAAAQAVCAGDGLEAELICDLILDLEEKSLAARKGSARYQLLETVRRYALGKLEAAGEVERLRRRQLIWCFARLEEAQAFFAAENPALAMEQMAQDQENYRAALDWTLATGDSESYLRLVTSPLRRFWYEGGHFVEGRQRLLIALDLAAGPTKQRASVLYGLTSVCSAGGYLTDAIRYALEAKQIYAEIGDQGSLVRMLGNLAVVAWMAAEYDYAADCYEQTITACRGLGDKGRLSQVYALNNLALLQIDQAYIADAVTHLDEAEQLVEGNDAILGFILHNRARIRSFQGDYTEACRLCEEGLAVLRACRSRVGVSHILNVLGKAAIHLGDRRRANAVLSESLSEAREQGDQRCAAEALELLARVALLEGDLAQARTLAEEALQAARESSHLVGAALALTTMGCAAEREQDWHRAGTLHREAISLAAAHSMRLLAVQILRRAAVVELELGQPHRAATLLAAGERLCAALRLQPPPSDRQAVQQAQLRVRSLLDEGVYATAVAVGVGMPWEEAVAFALREPLVPPAPPSTDQRVIARLTGQCASDLAGDRRLAGLGELLVRDPLTDLYNAAYLRHRLEIECETPDCGSSFALVMLDLDGFKQINDTRGHAAGDAVLQEAAAVLEAQAGAAATCIRYGGDEFVMLAPGLTEAGAHALAHQVLEALRRSGVAASAGIALWPKDAATPADLFAAADAAMYRAKHLPDGYRICQAP